MPCLISINVPSESINQDEDKHHVNHTRETRNLLILSPGPAPLQRFSENKIFIYIWKKTCEEVTKMGLLTILKKVKQKEKELRVSHSLTHLNAFHVL